MSAGCSMLAMTRSRPPHCRQVSRSMANTRLRRCAQVRFGEHSTVDVDSCGLGHLQFSPLMQRTPVATEAMYLMMKHAFELGYRRYEWKCDALNAASRRAAERLGFTFEGIFRQAIVYKGRSRDTAWYSILDREWPALDAALRAWLDPSNFDAEGRQRVSLAGHRAMLRGGA
jgi:hypothetical protein